MSAIKIREVTNNTYVLPIDLTNPIIANLSCLSLIKVSGADTEKYLQGQLTIDVTKLNSEQNYLTAHCCPKGKTWSVLQIWKSGDDIYYLLPSEIAEKQLSEIKKYAVFSKITFEIMTDINITAMFNIEPNLLTDYFNCPISQTNHCYNLAEDQFLLVLNENNYVFIRKEEEDKPISIHLHNRYPSLLIQGDEAWFAWQIKHGKPIITSKTTNEFIPQALNLQELDAISFTKGCYSGQEMIARAKYRGANKRAMYWLKGNASIIPTIGDTVEMQLGENWRQTGTILQAVRISKEEIWLQVVLSNKIDPNTPFRLLNDLNSELQINALPYTITD